MERSPHWKRKVVCAVCCRALDLHSVCYCSQNHSCCSSCLKNLKIASKGNDLQLFCPLCKMSGHIMESRIKMLQTCSNIKIKPGMCNTEARYPQNYQNNTCELSPIMIEENEEIVFENLIGMSKEKFYQLQNIYKPIHSASLNHKQRLIKSRFTLPASVCKRPFKCPHKPCQQTVAVAQFVHHFKSEHKDVQNYAIERGKELLLNLNASFIQKGLHSCVAMVRVYEVNRVEYLKETTSQSIAKTCSKFCQKVPISTYWVMISGTYAEYFLIWLFTNFEETQKCTIELASKDDSVSLSTFCGMSRVLDEHFPKLQNKLQGLIVTKSSLKFILTEGAVLNIRVTVH